jgi:uncharacterized protein
VERIDGELVVSATDLVGHLACGHLTVLDGRVTLGALERPVREDPELEVLTRRGLEHEAAYLQRLRAEGLTVVEIAEPDRTLDRLDALRQREAETREAMAAGADVIFQATFLDERHPVRWRGHADFLRKVDRPSALGAWSYEPEDTKLARQVKPSAVLQLCHYAEQVARLQGVEPEQVHVVLGGQERRSIRLAEVAAYYRTTKARFLAALAEEVETYPEPVGHCSVCRWSEVCERQREDDDHLCRVAGLGREQARKLAAAGVGTLTALATAEGPIDVTGIGPATLERLRRQARLQHQRGDDPLPPVEPIRPVAPDRGLAALPEPSPGDLFFDIEGDPFAGDGQGLEYLHGVGWVEPDGTFAFRAFWGHTPAEERRAFEALIDLIVERRRQHPDLHVYHYAPYEPTALGRLMGRYGTREDELDDLLRGEVFVDLYRAVHQGLVIGSPSYSLKKIEPLYMPPRTAEITDAGSSIVEYERWLQGGDARILADIEAYNRDDVESTWRLRAWLEDHRRTLVAAGEDVPRPARPTEPEATETTPAEDDVDALMARLLAGGTEPPTDEDDDDTRARWLMAHLLRWHQREDKPEWWRYFDRILRCDLEDLRHDTEAVADLTVVGGPELDGHRSNLWTYAFDPDQEHKLKLGSTPHDPESERIRKRGGEPRARPGFLVALDPAAGTLQLRRGVRSEAPHPRALIPSGPINTDAQREALQRLAQAVLDHGLDGPGPYAAARQLLGRRPPRIPGTAPGAPLRQPGESGLDAAVRLVGALDRSHLPIQGPPGSGKTYTAAHVILARLAEGRRVGITANSHAVITGLLKKVLELAPEAGVTVRAVQKPDKGGGLDHPAVLLTESNQKVDAGLADGANLVAGTAWLFARPELDGALDTLVVDEAGQLSLANVLAVAGAADRLVLVGDPRQLAQPSKGTHPEGAGVSGLEHVLGAHDTMPDDLGLFLDRTWRLHPDICGFISEQVYEGRLEPEPHCATQAVDDGPLIGGTGLRWLPVDHEGNRTSSPEEAHAVAQAVEALLGRGWTDKEDTRRVLGPDDVLVVAPYNAQVHLLAQHLPEGVSVGTVDKVQGKEAPVVVVSMTASSAKDVPRGLEFLYSRNRINVAVSRAQALCVMVASTRLLAVTCRTVDQMRLANVVCRYSEMAKPLHPSADQ